MKKNGEYPCWSIHTCIDSYKVPDDEDSWLNCPYCGLKPRVWVFDNGRSTACGCGHNMYRHFSIHAESIMSVHKRSGGTNISEYDSKDLKNNWNHWVLTGEVLFDINTAKSEARIDW